MLFPFPQMMLSFFLHNVVQPLIKNANPSTRRADIAIGYCIAAALYSLVGVMGSFGFADAHTKADCAQINGATPSACAPTSDFLSAFSSDLSTSLNIYAFTARTSLLLQLVTVFPILLLIIRGQVFTLTLGTSWPGWPRVLALNLLVMFLTTLFAALNLQIGTVLRFVGAIGGLVIVFAVPVGMELVARGSQYLDLTTLTTEPLKAKELLRSLGFIEWVIAALVLLLGLAFSILQFVPGLS
jgi:solute carrier family 38 (sodium-coupled neutral amino acid transporter), member 9